MKWKVKAWAVLDTHLMDMGLTNEPELEIVVRNKPKPLFSQIIVPCEISCTLPKKERKMKV